MVVKLFEVRDSMTFIPVLVVELGSSNDAEQYLLRRAGFSLVEKYHLLARIQGGGGMASTDPYEFTGNRTLTVALDYIHQNFDNLEPGQVIDVEHILGETTQAKPSERLSVLA